MAALVEAVQPDVIGLQETKVADEQFPLEMIHELGYQAYYHGQKTHYGVAMLVANHWLEQYPDLESTVIKGFAEEDSQHQRRFIGLELNGIKIFNGYFPQGESRDHPLKFPAKQAYYQNLSNLLDTSCKPDQAIILMGDLNVAPTDLDIGIGEDNAKRWLRTGKCSFLPEERAWFQKLIDWGLTDVYRHHHPEASDCLSWFDYRSRGFEKTPKHGLRIDHFLVSKPILDKSQGIWTDYTIRGMEKPSDHCPVCFEFEW